MATPSTRSISNTTSKARTESTPTSSRKFAVTGKSGLVSAIFATMALSCSSITAAPLLSMVNVSGGRLRAFLLHQPGNRPDAAQALGVDLRRLDLDLESPLEEGDQGERRERVEHAELMKVGVVVETAPVAAQPG